MKEPYKHTKPYTKEDASGFKKLRIGKEVPNQEVNLSYVHSKNLNPEDNISLHDYTSQPDIWIPDEQMESLVIPDENGKLSYAHLIANNEVQPKAPYDSFPVSDVSLTDLFFDQEVEKEKGLYHMFEINYHYESSPGDPSKVALYTGDQIKVTDANGRIENKDVLYSIHVLAMEENPHIHRVRIYMSAKTDEDNTFYVTYNHVSSVAKDFDVLSTRQGLELYQNKDHTIGVGEDQKHLLESGKVRIMNHESVFKQMIEGEDTDYDKTFSITNKEDANPNEEGYEIHIQNKTENDPRDKESFNYKISAVYLDENEEEVEVTTGYVNDWVTGQQLLLDFEQYDYTGEWKNIGIPKGQGPMSMKEMIQLSLPPGTPTIPTSAEYQIKDGKGNILYSTRDAANNPSVDSRLSSAGYAEAKANNLEESERWSKADISNVMIKSLPITHKASIIPEYQESDWPFEFSMDGKGYIRNVTSQDASWNVCANIGIYKEFTSNPMDVLDKTKWGAIGSDITPYDWKLKNESNGRSYLELQKNYVEVAGFYQKKNDLGENMLTKQNYEFTARFKATDPGDDDVIGILFRVRNSTDYYMFAWEKNESMTDSYRYEDGSVNGSAKLLISERGCSACIYREDYEYNSPKQDFEMHIESDWNKYKQYGFGQNKKRIYRAKKRPSNIKGYVGFDENSKDKTGQSFEDITTKGTIFNSTAGRMGWEYNKEYKLTLVVAGNRYQIFINENPDSKGRGQLVCEAVDNTYQEGSVGIHCMSQRWTKWYDLLYNELDVTTLCSPHFPVTFNDQVEKRISDQEVDEILKDDIEVYSTEKYGEARYEVFEYTAHASLPSVNVRVDEADGGYVWGKSTSPQAGGIEEEEWSTKAKGHTVEGKGHIYYETDGHLRIEYSPEKAPNDIIPDEVEDFVWEEPKLTKGKRVKLFLEGEDIIAEAVAPPIEAIGEIIHLPEAMIKREDGVQHYSPINGEEGIIDQLNLPSDINMDHVLLRLERGHATGRTTTSGAEHRVNYRFRAQDDDQIRLPMDQTKGQAGVNRIRLKDFTDNTNLSVVAWTHHESLQSTPVYAIRMNTKKKIEIEKPRPAPAYESEDAWYARVKEGSFKKLIQLPYIYEDQPVPEIYKDIPGLTGYAPDKPEDEVTIVAKFEIPEYKNQAFLNGREMFIRDERPFIEDNYTLRTRYAPIHLHPTRNMLEVYAFHEGSSRRLRVKDVDAIKGLIFLYDEIKKDDVVKVTYTYDENWVTYQGYRDKDDSVMHLDLNPAPGHESTWRVGDPFPELSAYHKNGRGHTTRKSQYLLAEQLHIYLRPVEVRSISGSLIWRANEKQSIFHTSEWQWFSPEDASYNPLMVRIGRMQPQRNSQKDDQVFIDSRTRGGGLDVSLDKETIRSVDDKSLYNWDIGFFDGKAYQKDGVFIVELPNQILKEYNEQGFTEEEILAVIQKHKAYGNYPIVEYYNAENVKREEFNLIDNPEFYDNEHLTYHDERLDTGFYDIKKHDSVTGDNHILTLKDNARYGLTIGREALEGHRFWEIEVKAIKTPLSTDRPIAEIEVVTVSGLTTHIVAPVILRSEWMVLKQTIESEEEIEELKIKLNHSSGSGDIHIDYVMIFPMPSVKNSESEIHEI